MSTPTMLIEKGEILIEGLKKVKFDMNDLLQQCRVNGYFDVSEIEYAFMEGNGNLSILPKEKYRPVTLEDLKIERKQRGLCANVIIDGKIMEKNLSNMGKNEEWLMKQIKDYDLTNILLATLDEEDKIKVYQKNKNHCGKEILE